MRKLLSLLFSFALISHSFAQSKVKPDKNIKEGEKENKLVGTWRLIEFKDLDEAASTWLYPYGKHPKGYFTYTNSGIVNLNICAETPLKISEDSAKKYIITLENWVNNYAESYFGTYTIDYNKSVVTHHVKGGSISWYIDTDQPRPFVLNGDTLIIGDSKTWKRVLVRE